MITGEPYGNISSDLYTVGNNFVDMHSRDKIARGIVDVNYDFQGGSSVRWISGAQYVDTYIRNDDDGSVDEDLRLHLRPIFRVSLGFAGVQYDFHLGNAAVLTPRVTYSWIDDQLVTPTDRVIGGVAIDRIFSHDLVNVQLNLTVGPWRAQAYMTNAGEEEYIQAHSGDAFHPDAYANEPRRYGLRVTRDFGF
jgi:hypothetical protein